MPDQATGRRNPARLPTGRAPVFPAIRDRAARVAAMRAATRAAVGPLAAGSAYAPPAGPEPARHHDIIPEAGAPGDGYRCGTCLLAVTPADYATGPAWRHAGDDL